jgi:predicted DNA-binding transcriptional regulator AlpA
VRAVPKMTKAARGAVNPKIPFTDAPPSNVRLLSKLEILERTGVTYVTIWKMMRAGTFPRSRMLGGKSCWIESEFNAWIATLPKTRLKGDTEAAA